MALQSVVQGTRLRTVSVSVCNLTLLKGIFGGACMSTEWPSLYALLHVTWRLAPSLKQSSLYQPIPVLPCAGK